MINVRTCIVKVVWGIQKPNLKKYAASFRSLSGEMGMYTPCCNQSAFRLTYQRRFFFYFCYTQVLIYVCYYVLWLLFKFVGKLFSQYRDKQAIIEKQQKSVYPKILYFQLHAQLHPPPPYSVHLLCRFYPSFMFRKYRKQ